MFQSGLFKTLRNPNALSSKWPILSLKQVFWTWNELIWQFQKCLMFKTGNWIFSISHFSPAFLFAEPSIASAFRNCTVNVPKDKISHGKESKPALKNVPLEFLEKRKCSFHIFFPFFFAGHTTNCRLGVFNVSYAVVPLKEITREPLIKRAGVFECQLTCPPTISQWLREGGILHWGLTEKK